MPEIELQKTVAPWNFYTQQYSYHHEQRSHIEMGLANTVMDIVFGTGHCFWDSGYLCHFSTEMTEIWSPGTSFQDVWTHKFSALYLLYFRSYEIFSGGKSGTKIGLELK